MDSGREAAAAQRQLESTQGSVSLVATHLRVLSRRFMELDLLPGGRQQLSIERRIEYDLICALFSDVAAAAKAQGGAA